MYIEKISPRFYDIADQAFAAEQYRLDLVAGMGYRKALEFLVKDYMATELRESIAAAGNGDTAALEGDLEALLLRPLVQLIKSIPHELISQVAQRCAWLGNDETHYTRLWDEHDIEDLKKLLGIVVTFISHEAQARTFLAQMKLPHK